MATSAQTGATPFAIPQGDVSSPVRGEQQQAGQQIIPLPIGGRWSSGDLSTMPDGHMVDIRNMLLRPNRAEARPPAVYDGLMSVLGLSTWEDLVNQQTRFLALDATKLYLKSVVVGNETFNAGTAGVAGTRLTSDVSYRGKWYGMLDDGAGNPTAVLVWDGTNLSSAPFNSTIFSRAIAVFNDRLYLAYPRVTSTPLTAAPTTNAYDWTTGYGPTNVNISLVTLATGAIVGRLSPTSTAVKACSVQTIDLFTVTASTSEQKFGWRFEARGVDPLYSVPITLQWVFSAGRINNGAYIVGNIITAIASDSIRYRYRCTVAGQSAVGGPPTFTPTPGATTVDGTVTWINEGGVVLQSLELQIPGATASPSFAPYFVDCTVPPFTVGPIAAVLYCNVLFYNTTNTSLTTLAPIDISYKDGITDGDPRKANHGQQWTAGDYHFPFFNKESSSTPVTVNLETLIWSEIADPKRIRGANFYEPKEAAGLPTALAFVGGRLLMYKRRAFWTFVGTADPDNPIQTEGPATIGVGCLGPQAIDTMEDEVFWIGENEVYRMRVGNYPRPLGGKPMREEILNKAAAGWVESQATYNMPILKIDKKNREVWVYTQKGKLYVYHLGDEDVPGVYRPYTPEKGQWTRHDINGQEVQAMAWNPVTGKMEISFGGKGLVRLDHTVAPAQDQIDSTLTFYPATMDMIFKPLELIAPRYDALLETIALFHLASASQAGNTLTASLSFDRGTTYTRSLNVAFDTTVARIPIPLWQLGPSLTVKLSYVGSAGAAQWALSRAEAILQIKRGEWPQTQPTLSAVNL